MFRVPITVIYVIVCFMVGMACTVFFFALSSHVPDKVDTSQVDKTAPGSQGNSDASTTDSRTSAPAVSDNEKLFYLHSDLPESLRRQRSFTIAQKSLSAEYISELGKEEFPEVHSTSLVYFVAGRYIDSPYRFSREGTAILVNGVVCDALPRFRMAEETPHPPPIEGATRESCFSDFVMPDGKTPWHIALLRYYYWRHDDELGMTKYIDAMKMLPFVKSVERFASNQSDGKHAAAAPGEGAVILLKMHGMRNDCNAVAHWPLGQDKGILSADKFINRLQERIKRRRDHSQTSASYFDGPFGYGLNGTDSPMYLFLPEIVDILESAQPVSKKLQLLGVYFGKEAHNIDCAMAMIYTFRGSPQLSSRLESIKAIRSSLGIHTMNDFIVRENHK